MRKRFFKIFSGKRSSLYGWEKKTQNCTERISSKVNIMAGGVPVAWEKLEKTFLD